jgi:hypothetical protein
MPSSEKFCSRHAEATLRKPRFSGGVRREHVEALKSKGAKRGVRPARGGMWNYSCSLALVVYTFLGFARLFNTAHPSLTFRQRRFTAQV